MLYIEDVVTNIGFSYYIDGNIRNPALSVMLMQYQKFFH